MWKIHISPPFTCSQVLPLGKYSPCTLSRYPDAFGLMGVGIGVGVGTSVGTATTGTAVGSGIAVGSGVGIVVGVAVGTAMASGSGVGVESGSTSGSFTVRAKMLSLSMEVVAVSFTKSTSVGSNSHPSSPC